MNKLSILVIALLALVAGYLLPHPADPPQPAEPVTTRSYRAPPSAVPADPMRTAPTPSLTPAKVGATPSPGLRLLAQQPSVFDTLHQAFQMAAGADMPGLRKLATEASLQADPLYHLHIADIFLERMTAIDPDQALDFAENAGTYEQRTQFIVSVLTSWVRSNETAVLAYYRSIDQLELKRQVAFALMRDSYLPAGLRAAVQQELGPYGDQLALSIQQQQTSAEEAFFASLNAPGATGMQQLYRSGMRWFRQDPDAALAEVIAMPQSEQRSALFTNMLGELAGTNPQQAMELLAQHAAQDDRAQQAVLYRFAHKDPIGARPYIEEYTERSGNSGAMGELLASWVRLDPQAATDYAATLPPQLRQRSLFNMAQAYAETSPRQALEWMLTLEPENARQLVSVSSRSGTALADAAQVMLNQVSDTEDRELLVESIARYKTQHDPQEAMQWLEQYSDHSNYQHIYSQALQQLADRNPQQATLVLDQRWYEPEMTDSFRSIAFSWGRKKPGEAIAWANSLPESAGRSAALSSLALMMVRSDPVQARNLYAKLPEGQDKENAAVNMAAQLAADSPQRMREIMAELGLPEQNIDLYMRIHGR